MAWKAFHESEKPALDRDPFAVTKHALRAALVFVDNELDKAGLYLAKVSSLTIAKMDVKQQRDMVQFQVIMEGVTLTPNTSHMSRTISMIQITLTGLWM